ncbi:MAG TPA: ABC transporter ATP-binding protein [Stellaceae bacterium]|nr:ABC transporter ATP-binding protein [Stellaceae bacterium]
MTSPVAERPALRRAAEPAASERPLITVEAVDKLYAVRQGEPVRALSDISFELRDGEVLSVVGPSGCGKSTLLRIMAGLDVPSRGRVLLAGERVSGPRREIGVVFQQATLLPWRTVLDNVLLPAQLQRLERARSIERARQLLDLVGLVGFTDKYPFELSGGMQQRVAICRALVCDPRILLMDEPFGALDAMTREQMNVELMRIQAEQKKSVVFITHSIPEAVFLGDRVMVMTKRPGRIARIAAIDLPKPRTLATMGSALFAAQCNDIRLAFSGRSEGAEF